MPSRENEPAGRDAPRSAGRDAHQRSAAAASDANAGSEANAPPDWSRAKHDLLCPRCEYNLRMLTHARCPECGLDFQWSEVIETAQRRASQLPHFEFQWRSRPVRSFFWTTSRLLRPIRFWRGLPMSAELRRPALLTHAALLMSFLVGVVVIVELATEIWYYLVIVRPPVISRSVITHHFALTRPWALLTDHGLTAARFALMVMMTRYVMKLFWQTRRRYRLAGRVQYRLFVYAMLCAVLCAAITYCAQVVFLNIWYALGGTWLPLNHRFITLLSALAIFAAALGAGLSIHARVRRGWAIPFFVMAICTTALYASWVWAATWFDSIDNPYASLIQMLFGIRFRAW